MFTLKDNVVTDPEFKANLNGNTLSNVESVTNLGVTFSKNAKWTAYVEEIIRKYVRLCFFVKKLRRLSLPAE